MAASARHALSKSDFKAARTCGTKLYYRALGYPSTKDEDPYLALLAEGGYMVELLAKQQFPEGVTLEHADSRSAARETLELLRRSEQITLFEATLAEGLRQARVDVLRRSATGFDLFEVKSSAIDGVDAAARIAKTGSPFRALKRPFGIQSKWIEHLEDVTYQVTILRDLFPGVPVRAHLVLVDKACVAAFDEMPGWFRLVRRGDGRLATAELVGDPERAREAGLTVTYDVTADVETLEAEVRSASATFLASLAPAPTRLPVELGSRCRECEYRVAGDAQSGFRECWGARGSVEPHVLDLYHGGELVERLIARGVDGIAEIPDAELAALRGNVGLRQRIQVEHTRSDEEFVDPRLRDELSRVRWPLYFIDFEAARFAVPHHRGMAPYGQLAFQWSCHTQRAPGAPLEHREWLNVDPRWPNEDFARALRAAVGDDGTLLVWSAFEATALREIAGELATLGSGEAELADWLRRAALRPPDPGARQLDMLTLCRERYFHPAMGGSNSIKAVLDALWKHSPVLRARYAALTGVAGDPERGPYAALAPLEIQGVPQRVAEGTGAVRAYLAMAYGVERDDPAIRARWERLLREYCKLDTLAMVLVWEHWRRATGLDLATG